MRAPTRAETLRAIWNDPDPSVLEAWTNEQLNGLDAEQELRVHELEERRTGWEKFPIPIPKQLRDPVEAAKAAGDIKALRALFPRIAEFIHPRKRQRGEHGRLTNAFERYGDRSPVADADAKLIREIWLAHFGENRRKTDPKPEEIAARRNGVTVQQIENFRKSKHR